MEQDFSDRTLQGRDFKNLDLTGANFSNADIRGANFTGAILRNANFSRAIAGLQPFYRNYLVILAFCVLVALGFIAAASGAYAVERLTSDILNDKFQHLLAGSIALIIVTIFAIISLKEGPIAAVVFLIAIIVIAVVFSVGFARAEVLLKEAKMVSEIIAIAVSEVAAIGAVSWIATIPEVLLAIVLSKRLARVIAICGLIGAFLVGVVAALFDEGLAGALVAGAIAIFGGIFSLLISQRVLAGDRQHDLIKTIAIHLSIWRGTNFKNADLTDANFTESSLKNTNFQEAILVRTFWHRAKYLKFAAVQNTYLRKTEIQKLLVTGTGENCCFDRQNFRGFNLSGANLKNASFIGVDFYQANLRSANLFGAKLIRSQFEQADLTGATLTGTCIEDWLVTRSTKLYKIECKYVFLKYIDGDKRDLIPRSGEFKDGDFILYIRSVLDTLDLYHEREINPKVAIAVLKTLSEDYQETFNIVGVERKDNDAIVLKLKTSELCDRDKIQEEYYHRYDKFLTISMQDPNRLILPALNGLIKQLNEALEKLRQTPNNITYIIQEFNNTGIFQTIENSQIQGDINLLQGDNNQLAVNKKFHIDQELISQLSEIKNSILNLELPQDTKQELLNSLQQYQNHLLKIEEKDS